MFSPSLAYALFLSISAFSRVHCDDTITLFDAIETQYEGFPTSNYNSFEISAIGTASDGSSTTYVEKDTLSIIIDEFGGISTDASGGTHFTAYATSTETVSAVTQIGTLVAGKSGYVYDASYAAPEWITSDLSLSYTISYGEHDTCTFDGNGGASCVDVFEVGSTGSEIASTTIFSATLVPFYTFTATSTNSAAGFRMDGAICALWMAIIGGMSMGILLVRTL